LAMAVFLLPFIYLPLRIRGQARSHRGAVVTR